MAFTVGRRRILLTEMEAAENIHRSKTLDAGSATLIFLAFFFPAVLIGAFFEILARTSLAWLGDFICPIIACLAMVLAAVRLIPTDIKNVGPTGAAWVLGRWENLIKGLAVGCIIGGFGHALGALNPPHVRYNGQFADPIVRAVVTPGVQQVLAIVALALLGPAVEEMMFRGILYGGYRKSFGPLSAAFVTTVLFVAMHFGYYIYAPYMIFFYIVSALALLWCRLRWNAIGPAITAHSGINLASAVIPSLIFTWHHAFYEKGLAEYKASNFNQAIVSLTHAIQLGDNSSSVYVYRGNAKSMKGDLDGAISDYSMAIVLNPKDSHAFYDRGLAKHNKDDFEGAITDYDEAITLNPKDSRAYHDRGLAKVGEDNFEAAIADFTAAIELNPTNSSYYNDRAWAEFKKGDFGFSIADATRSIQLGNNSSAVYIYRGIAKSGAGDVDGAISDYSKAIELDPKDSTAFYDRGLAKNRNTDFEGAIADYDKAIALDPANSAAYDDRALAELGDGKLEAAMADIDEAIKLDPTNSLYYNNRGSVEFQKDDFESSIADATHSIQLDSNAGYGYGTRGWARYMIGDISDAVEDCKRATQLHERGSAPFYDDQGLLDFIAKDYTHAIADWQNAIEKQPDLKKDLQPWIEKAKGLEEGSSPARTNNPVMPK